MSNALSIVHGNRTAPAASYGYPSLLGRGVFDDFFKDVFQDFGNLQRKTVQGYPVADIFADEEGNTVLEFALAGFGKDDLCVEVKSEMQTITVSSNVETSGENGRRIARRSFTKTYVNYDSNLDLSYATAKYENGLLTIVVPQRPEVKPVSIKIS
jgi:HSP20 family molecular chaperone IbpA